MSLGMRSGVNWMRLKAQPLTTASVRATSVLPRPGAPSTRTCPLREHRDEQAVDELLLPDDDPGHLLLHALEGLLEEDRIQVGPCSLPVLGHRGSIERAELA